MEQLIYSPQPGRYSALPHYNHTVTQHCNISWMFREAEKQYIGEDRIAASAREVAEGTTPPGTKSKLSLCFLPFLFWFKANLLFFPHKYFKTIAYLCIMY